MSVFLDTVGHGAGQSVGCVCCEVLANSISWWTQARDKVKEVAGKLASAVKTGRTLQMLEGMKQEDLAKNRVHQQNYEKQLKVLSSKPVGNPRRFDIAFGSGLGC